MNLQDLLRNPQLVEQLASGLGTDSGSAKTGLEALLPSVVRGLERNAAKPSGLDALTKALGNGNHDRYLDSPDLVGGPEMRDDGNGILGHIFGSKDVSRNVAAQASETAGLDSSLLKKMLPLVASLAMSALSKSSQKGSSLGAPSQGGGLGGLDLLGSLLGGGSSSSRGSENSTLDSVLDLAKKFF